MGVGTSGDGCSDLSALEVDLINFIHALYRRIEAMETEIASKIALGSVTIEVSGGVAECTDHPAGIEVEIIDHDDLAAEAESKGKAG